MTFLGKKIFCHLLKDLSNTFQIILVVTSFSLVACNSTPLMYLRSPSYSLSADVVNISITNYCPKPGNLYKQLFAANLSYILRNGEMLLDYDRDGVPDVDEGLMGLDSLVPDTSQQGYGDLSHFVMGMKRFIDKCPNPGVDSNHDGLTDCARSALGLSVKSFSTSGDGIPDFLKLRAGLDPRDSSIGTLNPMGDGYTNLEKIQMNLPTLETITPDLLKLAIHYRVEKSEEKNSCYNLNITNIPLATTQNGNLIRVYLVEEEPSKKWSLQSKMIEIPPGVSNNAKLNYSFSDLGEI